MLSGVLHHLETDGGGIVTPPTAAALASSADPLGKNKPRLHWQKRYVAVSNGNLVVAERDNTEHKLSLVLKDGMVHTAQQSLVRWRALACVADHLRLCDGERRRHVPNPIRSLSRSPLRRASSFRSASPPLLSIVFLPGVYRLFSIHFGLQTDQVSCVAQPHVPGSANATHYFVVPTAHGMGWDKRSWCVRQKQP
jgi:hypothetical protein